ncbi:MAG: DUF4388 domain-containing protein, partial [Deinococcales bacterium]
MAIFGNLSEFPMLEVMSMLERRCGILRFSGIEGYEALELHINSGVLQGVVVGATISRDANLAKRILARLASTRSGKFEFCRMPPNSPNMQNDLAINVNEILLRGAAIDDEWNNYKDQLPDPKTRFTLASQELVWLEGGLQIFWQRAEPLLEYGISVEDLALRLGMDIRTVQLSLYKLRSIGVVCPA